MVLLHYKKTEKNQFIMETTTQEKNSIVLQNIIQINNKRVKLDLLIKNLEGLADFGPIRPEALRGLTTPETYEPACQILKENEKKYAHPKPNSNQRINLDKTGYRLGVAPSLQLSEKIYEVTNNAKKLLNVDMVNKRKIITDKILDEVFSLIKGVVMIVYPAYFGLPEWDPVFLMLEEKMSYKTFYPDCDFINDNKIVLWWAKKELKGDKKLCDYIGKNEKTKIVVKVGKKGQGAPMSEPPIDKETQKKMMAYYYKKQEQMKKLEENNEDDYMNSEWANPNYLKNNLVNGGKEISYRGFFNR